MGNCCCCYKKPNRESVESIEDADIMAAERLNIQ